MTEKDLASRKPIEQLDSDEVSSTQASITHAETSTGQKLVLPEKEAQEMLRTDQRL